MARINIETSLYQDHRFLQLCMKLGSIDTALGAVVRAWSLAQRFYLIDDRAIPRSEWLKQNIRNEIIEVGLASEKNGRIRVCGADEQFGWLSDRVNAGRSGGKASSEKRKANKIKDIEAKSSKRKQTQAKSSKRNPPTLTLSLSPSPTLSPTLTPTPDLGKENKSPFLKVNESPVTRCSKDDLNGEIWKAYSSAYFARYKTDPVRNAKVNSQIAQLAKRLGSEAPSVVEFFVSHNKTFYVSKLHEIGLCLADAESLRTQWARGKAITNSDLKRFERASSANDLNQMIENGEI